MKNLSCILILYCSLTFFLQGADFNPASSVFANKPADSYSNYTDESGKPGVLLWGQAPFNDFGSRVVKFDVTGARKIRAMPAPGIHPRIYFGPDDLPDVRKRLKETKAGQEAWKNILCWTEMMKGNYDDSADYAKPDRWNGGFGGLHGRVPLYRLSVPREKGFAYNHHPVAAAIYNSLADGTAKDFPNYYWNTMALEAFRTLIENDKPGAKKCAQAVVTALKLDQAKRDAERDPKKKARLLEQPIGTFQLAFAYDYLFNQLTSEQKKAMHDELAATTWSHDNYGTFNTAESARSNWATFSYWLFEVLAIEGEPGFNDLKVRGMYRGWRNLLTYGWFQSGATFEGEAKNQLGMDGIIPFLMRQDAYGFENLAGHPYLRAYATKFLPHSTNAMLTGLHKYDLLGGSRSGRGGANPADIIGLKYVFPDDKAIDWVYRQLIGENYEGIPDRPDGYYNAVLFSAIFPTNFDPANNDPAKLNLGNTFFCGERALMMTRSSWDKEATQLNMHTRQANGGHPFSDRNAIMVAGAGRIWSPNGYASFRTAENSVVSIVGQSQSEIVPGRCVDFVDSPLASFMVGDAKYCWDWNWKRLEKKKGFYTTNDVRSGKVEIPPGWEPVKQTANDFAYTKLDFSYLNVPEFEYAHWIQPKGALSPYVRQPSVPVQRAFRTAGLVRGEKPYILVVDDIQKDTEPHEYDWTLALEKDIQIAHLDKKNDHELDIILTGSNPDQNLPEGKEPLSSEMGDPANIPANQPMLLVRVLNYTADEVVKPEIVELPNAADAKKYRPIRRLVIKSKSVTPEFKVLIYPYRQGATLPETKWNEDHSVVAVAFGKQIDQICFTPAATGKTNLTIMRDAETLASLTKEVTSLP